MIHKETQHLTQLPDLVRIATQVATIEAGAKRKTAHQQIQPTCITWYKYCLYSACKRWKAEATNERDDTRSDDSGR